MGYKKTAFRFSTAVLFFCLNTGFVSCNESSESNKPEAVNSDTGKLSKKYNLDKIKLPVGFKISVYAEVPNARSMALSPSGTLFVGNRGSDKVYAVTDKNKDGKADNVYVVATGLNSPNGVAFKDGSLYIATITSILRLDSIESRLSNPPKMKPDIRTIIKTKNVARVVSARVGQVTRATSKTTSFIKTFVLS